MDASSLPRRTLLTAAAAGGAALGLTAPAAVASPPGGSLMTHQLAADTTTVLRNPLTGWVLYGTGSPDADYWENYDDLVIEGSEETVRVADYAHTLYFRLSWTVLNPEEGVYGWDVHEGLRTMIEGARERDMRLAFRVVVDSRDKPSDFTPAYVREAGAQGYENQVGSNTVWSPYPDDPIFQEKYATFVHALAERFDDPAEVEFVDGYGLGKWGEGHSMVYLDDANREDVYRWIVDLYAREFQKVPLAINYHRMIGGPKDWGDPDPGSAALLRYAVEQGYMLRHDAFGMTTYYAGWERDFAAPYLQKLPVMFEGGWVTAKHPYWDDPRGYETVEDVRRGEYEDAIEAHVNTMDFRIGETESWFETAPDLVADFIARGGYRLFPQSVEVPGPGSGDRRTTITHTWENLGWGVFPAHLPQWEGRFAVAFARLDPEADHAAVEVFLDEQADPGSWLQGETHEHTLDIELAEVPAGPLTWGVAIVDTHADGAPAIELAAQGERTAQGWLILGS